MKTDHDLAEELSRRLFAHPGAPAWKVELLMSQWRLEWKPKLKQPAQPLTDEQYAAKIAQLDAELPAFVEDLLSRPHGPLPPNFFGQDN